MPSLGNHVDAVFIPESVNTSTTLRINGGDLHLDDGKKALFGQSDDLQIFHDGSNNYILGSNGNIILKNSSSNYLVAKTSSGAVELNYNNSKKFETTSDGATVTGTALATALSTGAAGTGINISTGTITGPATLTIDPAAIGDDTGLVIIKGNFQVDGTTTTINSTTMTVDDKNIVLASGAANAAAADGAGITIDGADATLLYKETPDAWSFNKNIGIGTDSPNSLLHLSSNDDTAIILADTSVADTHEQTVLMNNSGSFNIRTHESDGTFKSIDYLISKGSSGATDHRWRIENSEKMQIDSSGRLLVGTSSASSNIGVLVVQGYAGVTAGEGTLDLVRGNNVTGAVQGLGSIKFGHSQYQGASIDALAEGAWTEGSSHPAYLSLATTANGASSPTERMRIDSSGNVGIGTSSMDFSDFGSNTGGIAIQDIGATNTGLKIGDGSNTAYLIAAGNGNCYQSHYGSGSMIFGVGNGTGTERMRIDSAGNVGIGTTSPDTKLDVNGNVQFGDGGGFDMNINGTRHQFSIGGSEKMRIDSSGRLLVGTSTAPGFAQADLFTVSRASNAGITIRSGSAFSGVLAFSDGTGGGASEYRGLIKYDHTDDSLALSTNSVERMQIDSSGVVKLTQSGNNPRYGSFEASSDAFKLKAFSGNASHNATMQFFTGADSPTERMRIDSSGNVGIGTTSPSDKLHVNSPLTDTLGDGNIGIGGTGVALFSTRLSATSGNFNIDRLYAGNWSNVISITRDSGRVGINDLANGYAEALQVTGNYGGAYAIAAKISIAAGVLMRFGNSTGVVGSITCSSSSVSYNTSSDYRLKENVVDIADGITRVKQLSPKRFNFISDVDTTVDGFLAHEAQTVIPEAVTGVKDEVDDDGNAVMQGIDQAKLVPLLTAALQEAIAKIETLEQRLTDAGIA